METRTRDFPEPDFVRDRDEGEFYVEYDEEVNDWGVFGSETGHCYLVSTKEDCTEWAELNNVTKAPVGKLPIGCEIKYGETRYMITERSGRDDIGESEVPLVCLSGTDRGSLWCLDQDTDVILCE